MHIRKIVTLLAILIFFQQSFVQATGVTTSTVRNSVDNIYQFGVPVRFVKGATLPFQGLSLRYLGERHFEHSGPGPQPRLLRDFEAADDKHITAIYWSNEYREPLKFLLGDDAYILEIGASILLNNALAIDELVLWREQDFVNRTQALQPVKPEIYAHAGLAYIVKRLPDPRMVAGQWDAD